MGVQFIMAQNYYLGIAEPACIVRNVGNYHRSTINYEAPEIRGEEKE